MGSYSYNGSKNTPASVQTATITQTGVYDIVGYGAQGGSPGFAKGGDGAETGGYFNLVAGEKLKIVVGGAGQGGINGAGGGGGSFVLASTDGGTTYSLLLASGGGGGAYGFSNRGSVGGGGQSTAAPGSGNGGTAGGQYGAGGGAGFKTGGASGGGRQGIAAGGASSYTSSGAAGQYSGPGGFGGGGGGGNNGSGGGGGGYSGGNGGGGAGTGGTSINKGTPIAAQTLAAVHTGNGLVAIALALSITLANDTGSSNGDSITKDDTVTGTARNAGTITFTDGGGNTLGSVTTTAADQTYTFNPGNKLAQGAGMVTATETASGVAISSTVTLTYDTTPPVDSSPTLTVAQNSGPTPIGIGAPTDNVTPTSNLAIAVGTLPSDGIVTLSDGKTAVTAGESLTSAQLQGLEFTPTPGASGESSAFTYTVTDGAGNSSTGTATLNIDSPPAPAPTPASNPTITGTHATSDAGEQPVQPFSGVTVADANAGATDSLAITLTGGGGMLTGNGLTGSGTSYALAATDPTTLSSELDALTFTPTTGAAGAANPTTFTLTDTSSAGTSATDSNTVVTDTAAATPAPVTPTPVPVAPGSGGVVGVTPSDTVSLSNQVTYNGSAFAITGTASSAAGVRSVEISAQVDGVATDLGAATVDANGTFNFSDLIGAHTQGFITATETDGAGGTAAAQANYSLTGGLDQPNAGRAPFVAEQDVYTADGSAETSTSLFRGDGSPTNDASRRTTIMAAGQTFTSDQFDDFKNGGTPETTFVFNPNHGLDTISLFRVDGADHDTLSFSGADFGNSIANVLRDTHQTSGGSSIITDPTTGDTVKLVGITKQQLAANQGDFTFHA